MRIGFGVTLVASVALVWLAIFALITASSQDNRDRQAHPPAYRLTQSFARPVLRCRTAAGQLPKGKNPAAALATTASMPLTEQCIP